MKTQDVNLTLQETEQLCRLYMECRLTVLEETELQYVLGKLPYSSPCIDEVRMLMGITIKHKAGNPVNKHFPFMGNRPIYSVAASIMILLVAGLTLFSNRHIHKESDTEYYIAYVGGQRLSDESARLQIEAEQKSVDDFMEKMAESESRNKQMIDNFFNP